jgi:ribonuclease-3
VSTADDLRELARTLEHEFRDPELLTRALTHRSVGARGGSHNEILEFLGDSVLGLVVSELLVRAWPSTDEGMLSRRRAALVNENALADKARQLRLGLLIALGRGEEKTGGRDKASILAGAFEAVLGAVFLDGGLEPARRMVARSFSDEVRVDPAADVREFKTRLQELAQRVYRTTPEYRLIGTTGPDHAKHFESHVVIDGRVYGSGRGASKKLAEQAAAEEALLALEGGLAAPTGRQPS